MSPNAPPPPLLPASDSLSCPFFPPSLPCARSAPLPVQARSLRPVFPPEQPQFSLLPATPPPHPPPAVPHACLSPFPHVSDLAPAIERSPRQRLGRLGGWGGGPASNRSSAPHSAARAQTKTFHSPRPVRALGAETRVPLALSHVEKKTNEGARGRPRTRTRLRPGGLGGERGSGKATALGSAAGAQAPRPGWGLCSPRRDPRAVPGPGCARAPPHFRCSPSLGRSGRLRSASLPLFHPRQPPPRPPPPPRRFLAFSIAHPPRCSAGTTPPRA